ncbi:ribonuclease P [Malassezia sp. CBS 17886]|nr:ribonuclease P [Malassezia sp. CBS 17886]
MRHTDQGSSAAQVHVRAHTQRHKARASRGAQTPHGKDARMAQSVLERGGPVDARRRVFRPVLTSPYVVQWPRIAKVDAEMILHTLVEVLCAVGERADSAGHTVGWTGEHGQRGEGDADTCAHATQGQPRGHRDSVRARLPSCATAGINAVTRTIEGDTAHALAARSGGGGGGEGSASAAQLHAADAVPSRRRTPQILFACEADTNPAALLAHIPMLVGSYNAVCAEGGGGEMQTHADDAFSVNLRPAAQSAKHAVGSAPPLLLVPLPQGAEFLLSTAMQVRRLSALLVDSTLPDDLLRRLRHRIAAAFGQEYVARGFRVPWLDESVALLPHGTTPVHIRHMSSGAPTHLAKAPPIAEEWFQSFV